MIVFEARSRNLRCREEVVNVGLEQYELHTLSVHSSYPPGIPSPYHAR
jgi:hypothetical protein